MVNIRKFVIEKSAAQWATAYSYVIYSMSQREEERTLLNNEIRSSVATILAGGWFVSDETLNEILSRKTIIQIRHNDNNCLWYPLVFSINNCRSDKFT